MRWGYDHESFWDQTAKTLLLTGTAYAARKREEHNERQTLAWHIAALQRIKKLPRLKTLLIETPVAKRGKQTWQEQLAVMDRLATLMQARYGSPMTRITNARRDDT